MYKQRFFIILVLLFICAGLFCSWFKKLFQKIWYNISIKGHLSKAKFYKIDTSDNCQIAMIHMFINANTYHIAYY